MKKLNLIFHTISGIDRIYSPTHKKCVFEGTTLPTTDDFKVVQNNSGPERLKVEGELSKHRCFFFTRPLFSPEVIFTLRCLPSRTNTRASLQQTPATSTPILLFPFKHKHMQACALHLLTASLLETRETILTSIHRVPFWHF